MSETTELTRTGAGGDGAIIRADKRARKHTSQVNSRGGIVNQGTLNAELDKLMLEVWEQVPMWRKLTFSLTGPLVLVAGLVSVLVLPPVAGPVLLLEASLLELLAALGLGLITTSTTGEDLNSAVEEHAARPQLSALFAFLQDHLGLPRATDDDLKSMNENKGLRLTSSPKDRQGRAYASKLEKLYLTEQIHNEFTTKEIIKV